MRLVTYRADDHWRGGIVVGERVVDLDSLPGRSSETPSSVREAVELSTDQLRQLGQAADSAAAAGDGTVLAELTLGPPVVNPRKIVCLGLNYRDHAAETELALPDAPMLFAKYATSLVGEGAPVVLPAASEKVDYEGELALVIGRPAKEVDAKDALDYVAGYMPFNDISARDLQLQTSQWMAGKAIDTFAPCGPALVSADEIPNPHDLELTTRVNGEVVQNDSTGSMIFSVPQIIAFISKLMTLLPGDIIATGTPSGVGQKRNPPVFLKQGDTVEVEIERLGTLTNPVVSTDDAIPFSEAHVLYQ